MQRWLHPSYQVSNWKNQLEYMNESDALITPIPATALCPGRAPGVSAQAASLPAASSIPAGTIAIVNAEWLTPVRDAPELDERVEPYQPLNDRSDAAGPGRRDITVDASADGTQAKVCGTTGFVR
jgi:hypothetical protein